MGAIFSYKRNSTAKVNTEQGRPSPTGLGVIQTSLSQNFSWVCRWLLLLFLNNRSTGSPDGSLSSLTPVEESAFKRLQLLQGQLTRNIQHIAGLNPRAFRWALRTNSTCKYLIGRRIVRNDYVSKPLSKGILDGNILAQYEALPITRQNEVTRQIGTERLIVLRDWISLSGPW